MTIELPPDDPWVSRGYGQGSIEPGERPAVLVIDESNLRDVHRRYAEVTASADVIAYLDRVRAEVPA